MVRQFSNRDLVATWKAADGEQRLMLLRRQTVPARIVLAESKKASEREAKVSELDVVTFRHQLFGLYRFEIRRMILRIRHMRDRNF